MFGSGNKKNAELLNNYHKVKKGTFDFGKIEQYFSGNDKTDIYQVISDKTNNDLDLDELFMFIDRTVSKVGQQFFYHIFRTIPQDRKRCNRFENLIRAFEENPALKTATILQLARLNHHDAYYLTSLFQEEYIQQPKWFWAIQLLSLLSIISVALSFFFPQFVLLLICILAINFIIHYWNKMNIFRYAGSIPQLLLLNQVAKEILKLKAIPEKDHALYTSIKTIDSIGYRMSFFKLEAKLQSDVGLLVEYIFELIKALFLLEPILLFNVLKELDSKREQIHQVYQFVGEMDVALSIASLRNEVPYYTNPLITEKKKEIGGKDIYHPLLENFVSNSIKLHHKSALLTGSNMSGKTTFIRTVGINAIVAQTINTCFAREFIMPPLKIHSAIRIADDMMSDKSYYFEEVLTIKKMLEESCSGAQNLFLLDEMFKGTNTVERIAAGKSVLTYLNNEDNIVFISTHDLELADYLEDTFNLYHFTEVVGHGKILFDYKLKAGNLQTTNAIRILELNGYPVEVTEEAKLLSEKLNQIKMVNS
jgi:hypothetical protein